MPTYIPNTYFDLIMNEMMSTSIGYFFDTAMDTFVLDCDQRSILKDVYVRFADETDVVHTNQWFSIQPNDFMREIDETE